jgi:hypothetical protein
MEELLKSTIVIKVKNAALLNKFPAIFVSNIHSSDSHIRPAFM